ncbi:Methylphosphotriester-DNA--protein-cysteine methyltransferase (N-terminal fragment of Ada) [Fructobacillus tropaeoli]|uniref:DNA/RNA non-specific endonuclease n=1 Tax=Fructobacillus tropaeoli TaxID=709323 RepID=UPI002D983935|nr:Methylphosphotriester-DNA--protein-cysteine methyltransferase (N-terminal fragment of Ada) [Fructobacillus tropaeoli]
MNGFFVMLFFVSLIWLMVEWMKNKRAGLKLPKRGKWLLAATLAFFMIAGVTTPTDQSQADDKPKAKKSATTASQSKKSAATSSSAAATQSSSTNVDQKQQTDSGLLAFTGKRQMVMGDLDRLGRATYSHIQLQDKDEPKVKRAAKLKYNPVGWHNFKFYYGDGTKQAWVMNRGHLVGYQFSGLNDEPKNLVPETAWMNAGNYKGMNDSNQDSMLFYENRLDSWLANHPNYWLDYQVTPIYQGDELIPCQVKLDYVGLDSSGKTLVIKLGSGKESTDSNGVTHVVLDNVTPNGTIDYASGRATNTVAEAGTSVATKKSKSSKSTTKKQEQSTAPATQSDASVAQSTTPTEQSTAPAAQPTQSDQGNSGESDRTVYVTGGGKSDVYWYSTDSMPARTNKANIITMTEAQAKAQGKRLSLKQ